MQHLSSNNSNSFAQWIVWAVHTKSILWLAFELRGISRKSNSWVYSLNQFLLGIPSSSTEAKTTHCTKFLTKHEKLPRWKRDRQLGMKYCSVCSFIIDSVNFDKFTTISSLIQLLFYPLCIDDDIGSADAGCQHSSVSGAMRNNALLRWHLSIKWYS